MANYVTLTDDNFDTEVVKSNQVVLVDFWATWCGPCKAIAPMIEELANEFSGKAKIGKLDVDQNPEVSSEFGIRSIPTLFVFKNGKVVDQIVGLVPKSVLVDKINQHM
jgi:thioredoxin 1